MPFVSRIFIDFRRCVYRVDKLEQLRWPSAEGDENIYRAFEDFAQSQHRNVLIFALRH